MGDEIPDRLQMAKDLELALDEMNAILGMADLDRLNEPVADGEWARRDALAHLIYWHEICLWSLRSTMDGTYVPVDLSNVDESNHKAVADKSALANSQLIDDFKRTGSEIVETMLQVPDELWNTKPRLFKWVTGTTLGHYPEHRDHLAAAKAV